MINQNKKMNLREKDRRGKMVIAVLLLIAVIGVGYAALGANLKINGVANIPSASWDVHFKTGSIAVTSGSVTGTNVTTAATITNATQVDYSVKLALPGDFYEFTVTAENTGTIDAMIDSVVSKRGDVVITTGTLPSYIDYSVTYADGVAIAPKHMLAKNTEETYKVRIAYKTDIESSELPGATETLNLNFQINYVQADDTATSVPHPVDPFQLTPGVYSLDSDSGYIGQVLPDSIDVYNTTSDQSVVDWISYLHYYILEPFYLKHVLDSSDNTVLQTYIEFKIEDEVKLQDENVTVGTYEIRGGVDESNLLDEERVVFNKNVMILNRAFGEENCSYEDEQEYLYQCMTNSSPYLKATISPDGHVTIGGTGDVPFCTVEYDQNFFCYH
ncbi:MAG: hypothetical protein IKE70_02065 [Bacilli bacterium]|nr:hypothetical protein [Bacilli bacterium]